MIQNNNAVSDSKVCFSKAMCRTFVIAGLWGASATLVTLNQFTPFALSKPLQALSLIEVAEAKESPVGKVSASLGKSYILRNGEKISVRRGMSVFKSDQLVTTSNAVVKILFADGSKIVAMKESSFEIEEYQSRANGKKLGLESVMGLVRGKIKVLIKPRDGGHEAVVKTNNAVMGVRGTEFVVTHIEGSDKSKAETQLVVLEGAVAMSPRDLSNSSKNQKDGTTKPKVKPVLVSAGQAAQVKVMQPVSAPKKVSQKFVANLLEEEKELKKVDAIPDKEVLSELSIPPPVPKNTRKPSAIQNSSPEILVSTERASATSLTQVSSTPHSSHKPVVIIPRSAVVLTEIGLSCDTASLHLLREKAQTFDKSTETLVRQLAPCEALQDEVFVWSYIYHTALGSSVRVQESMNQVPKSRMSNDLETKREKSLSMMRKGDSSGVSKEADRNASSRSHTLLLARTQAISGNHDAALKAYNQATKMKALQGNAHVHIEKGFLLLVANRKKEALSLFRMLLANRLNKQDRAAARRGLKIAESSPWNEVASIKDVSFNAFLKNKATYEDHEVFEFGLGWQGEVLSAASSIQKTKLATNGSLEPLLPAISNEELRRTDEFNMAKFTLGARYEFSTKATVEASASLYAGESPIFGANLKGAYPIGRFRALLNISLTPVHEEFASAYYQLERQTLTLGGGVAFENMATYSLFIEQQDEAETALVHGLDLRFPLHQGLRATDLVDLVAEARFTSGQEPDPFVFSPKSEFFGKAGGDINWQFGSFRTRFRALFGVLSRETRDTEENEFVPQTDWQIREDSKQEVLTDFLLRVGYQVQPALEFALQGHFENADSQDGKVSHLDRSLSANLSWNYSHH